MRTEQASGIMVSVNPNAAVQHRSFSQVKQLRQCGWSYKLERLDRVPSRPSAPAVAGVAVHTGTETVDSLLLTTGLDLEVDEADDIKIGGNAAALKALEQQIRKNEDKGWPTSDYRRFGRKTAEKPNGEDVEWFRQVGVPNSINAYVDWRLENPNLTLVEIPGFGPAIEVPFNYYIGDQLIHGFIDRIFTDKESGGYYPVDLKSGLKPKTDEQLGLYARALNMALGWEIEWGYYVYALKTGRAKMTPPLSISHWTHEKLGQVYLPASQAIKAGIFVPNPGENCFICSVSEHCAFVQAVA